MKIQQGQLFFEDFSNKNLMIGLSGGINSMASLIYLAKMWPKELRPDRIYLFYAHFDEHSDDTEDFVNAGVAFARANFSTVVYERNENSVIEFFRDEKMIPHPMLSPCTYKLKIQVIEAFMRRHSIDHDLIGYVKHEKRRLNKQIKNLKKLGKSDKKRWPILHLSDENCLDMCRAHLGFVPKIYDIKENGVRVFSHNNCLPCKNGKGYLRPNGEATNYFAAVKKYYPVKFNQALELSKEIGAFWGRGDGDFGHCSFCED